MKNLIRKWLGINDCATYYQHCEMVKQVGELREKLRQLDEFGPLPENSNLYHIINRLIAIQEYLKLDIKWEWQNDPSRLPEPHPQIKVWKAYKRVSVPKKDLAKMTAKKLRDDSIEELLKWQMNNQDLTRG